jgi:flagellar hook-length control protein FliK
MTTDLFFAPALPRKLPSSFQCDRSEAFSSSPGSKTDVPGFSKDDKPGNFLTTLERVARDQNSDKSYQRSDSSDRTPCDKTGKCIENDRIADQQSHGEEILAELMSLFSVDESSPSDESPVGAELSELISLLEAMGWAGASGDHRAFDSGMSSPDSMSGSADSIQNILSAIKAGNDTQTGMEQLLQTMARALTTDSSVSNPDLAPGGLNQNQSQVSVDLMRWAKSIIQGQDHPGTTQAAPAGDSSSTEKPIPLATVAKEQAMVESGGQLHRFPGAKNHDRADAFKSTPEIWASAGVDGSSRNLKDPGSLPGNGPANTDANEMAAKTPNGNRNAPVGHSMPSETSGHSLQENAMKGDSPPVSKALDGTAAGKDNFLKIDPAMVGDDGPRVIKSEGGTNDGGQWTSQGQTSERTAETAATPKEAEGTLRDLRSQTMEQIVRRAVFQIKDGQQEARIDLKPDFLGHVRMQVITENQQVTIKILTEFGFVKDMLENNIQQLKADLQQQGLEVDKLDVSVSRDSNGKNHQQEHAADAGNQSPEKKAGSKGQNPDEDQQGKADRTTRKSDGLSTVDFFA